MYDRHKCVDRRTQRGDESIFQSARLPRKKTDSLLHGNGSRDGIVPCQRKL
jgi:hypothetical protein